MVAIEHRQKSAIIATETETSTTTNTNLTTAAAINTTTTTSSPRRSSDIVNSNDISVLSPSSVNSTSSTVATATTTSAKKTEIAASEIVVVIPLHNTKDHEQNVESNTSPNLNNRQISKMSQSSSEASTVTAESAAAAAAAATIAKQPQKLENDLNECAAEPVAGVSKSAVSQRNVDIKIAKKSNKDGATQELTKKVLKLDLSGKELDEYSIKSPKSPIATRLQHQTSLTTVDVEDRKTLREALYHGIFHRHRRTIFAVGSFLRMLRSRNSSYNTIRSSSEGEDIDEVR